MKRCTKCGERKSLCAFPLYGQARPGQRQAECNACHLARMRRRAVVSKRWIREYAAGWRRKNRPLIQSANDFMRQNSGREFRLPLYFRRRHDAILAYGGYRCVCCGITEPLFLTIDHMDNDGARHRRRVGGTKGFFQWLEDNGYPRGFQVLCINCNQGRHRNGGICPHKDPVRKPGRR